MTYSAYDMFIIYIATLLLSVLLSAILVSGTALYLRFVCKVDIDMPYSQVIPMYIKLLTTRVK